MKFLKNMTLGKRLAILTALWLVIIVGVFGFLGIRAVNQSTEVMLQDRLTTAHLLADYLSEAIQQALNELRDVARPVEVSETRDAFDQQAQILKERYRLLSIHIHSIYLLDKRHQIIWCEPDSPGIRGYDISIYHSVELASRSGEPSVSGLVLAPLDNVPVIFFSSPVMADENGDRGVLTVAIDPARSNIGGFIKPIRLGETGYVELVDQNGIVIARTERGPKLAPFEKSDHSGRFAALIVTGRPTIGRCHTCHVPVQRVERRDVLAFMPLSTARWGVVIRQSEEEALAPVRELRYSLIVAGAIIALILFLFVATFSRDVVNRIRILTAASRRIANGDLRSPIVVSQKDEVGTLAQTFEEMREKLKTSYGALEQKTKELSSLLSISMILSHLPDLSNLDGALGNALDKTLEIIGENSGSLFLWDDEKQMLCRRVSRGLDTDKTVQVCYPPGEGICGRAAQTGEVVLASDVPGYGSRSSACIPLRSGEKILGVLEIAGENAHELGPDNIQLLEGIARVIAAAVENAKLHQQVQEKEKMRGELLHDMFSIQEEERKRIARELHDEISQVLAGLNASIETAVGMLPAESEEVKAVLRKAEKLSTGILEEIYELIYELRPSLLDDMGLVAAIRWLAENNLSKAGIKVHFKTVGRKKRLSPQVETVLFRIIQEAVRNIIKHANTETADITLCFQKGALSVDIRDEGVGFDVNEAVKSKKRPRGLGLLSMKERVELVNGTLDIQSQPGSGTRIYIEIPV